MYPHTENAPGDRRQADVDEHPRNDQLDARQDEQYDETPAGQRDYGTGETAAPDRTYDEPAGDQEGYAEPERPGGDLRDEPAAAPTNGAPADRPAADAPADTGPTERAPQPTDDWQLFGTEDADSLRSRWTELLGEFVDDPRQAVEHAEQLVSEVVQTLTDRFNERKKELQTQGSPDTEELRLAMIRYRTFFSQLLGG